MLFYRSQDYVPKAQRGIKTNADTYLPGRSPEEMRANPDNYDTWGNYRGDDYSKPQDFGGGALEWIGGTGIAAGLIGFGKKLIKTIRLGKVAKSSKAAQLLLTSGNRLGKVAKANQYASKQAIKGSKTATALAKTKAVRPDGAQPWTYGEKQAGVVLAGGTALAFGAKEIYNDYSEKVDRYQNRQATTQAAPATKNTVQTKEPVIIGKFLGNPRITLDTHPKTKGSEAWREEQKSLAKAEWEKRVSSVKSMAPEVQAKAQAKAVKDEKDAIEARKKKIRVYQKSYGFTGNDLDGIWGKNTQAEYEKVKKEQEDLKLSGLYTGEADGIAGKYTKMARSMRDLPKVYDEIKNRPYKKGGIFYNN